MDNWVERRTRPPTPLDQVVARAWVEAFIDALCDLEGHHNEPPVAPRQVLTAQERSNLDFLLYRIKSGALEP